MRKPYCADFESCFFPSLGCRPVIGCHGCRGRAKGTRGGYASKRLEKQDGPRTEQKRTCSGKQLWGVEEGLPLPHGNEGAASTEYPVLLSSSSHVRGRCLGRHVS